ncbi:MAG: DUF6338 family protein [Campylobacterota bacterium]
MAIDQLMRIEYILGFASLILPGFLIMKIIKLKVPNKDFLLKDMLFEAFAYSLLNLALFGWIPYLLLSFDNKVWAIIVLIGVLTITPIILAFLYIKVVSSKYFTNNFDIQMPTAWDWYFSQREECIVLVNMKDGSEVIGYMGDKSYATSFPNEGSLYLEKVYQKKENGQLVQLQHSKGILIAQDQYNTIEFYDIGE